MSPLFAPDRCSGYLALRPINLSLREVEELKLELGVDVLYETTRRWPGKFGLLIDHTLRRRQLRPGDVLHLDEAGCCDVD